MPQDILITPGSGEPQILFRGSGIRDTSINLNVVSSYQSASTSGTALLFEGAEGQLFAITDNLSSGTIFAVGDYTGLPIIDVDASGIVSLSRYGSVVDVYNALQIKPSGFGASDMSPVRFYGTGINFIGLRGPASIPTNTTFTLPSGDGQSGQILSTNGAGQLSWVSQSATGGTGTFSRLLVTSDSVVNNTVQIRAASLQSSNLTEWQNNAGTILSSIDNSGTLRFDTNPLVSTSGILYIDNSRRVATTPNITFSNTNIASPKLIFTPSGTLTPPISLNLLTDATNTVSGVSTLSFEGSAGQLFSITDQLASGTIFSVNDIGGLPLIEADASGLVHLGRYGEDVRVYKNLNIQNTYSIKENIIGNASGNVTINLASGNYVMANSTAATTWTVSGVPNNEAVGFILQLASGGLYTQTWPTGCRWPGGNAPTLTPSGIDVLTFITTDFGSSFRAVLSMQDSK